MRSFINCHGRGLNHFDGCSNVKRQDNGPFRCVRSPGPNDAAPAENDAKHPRNIQETQRERMRRDEMEREKEIGCCLYASHQGGISSSFKRSEKGLEECEGGGGARNTPLYIFFSYPSPS